MYGNWHPQWLQNKNEIFDKFTKTKYIYEIIVLTTVPNIILVGPHTSNNSLRRPLTTQWYWYFSTVVQFCFDAILPQFFLRAATSHCALEVGQESTTSTLATASWQYLFWLVHSCCRKMVWNYFLVKLNSQIFHWFKDKFLSPVQILPLLAV